LSEPESEDRCFSFRIHRSITRPLWQVWQRCRDVCGDQENRTVKSGVLK
jgi:hypothetical protein